MRSVMMSGPVLVALAAGTATAAGPLSFDQVFGAKGEPATIHFQVAYRSAGAVHHVEVWRDGDRRLRRETDGVLTSYVFRGQAPADYRIELLDHRRKIHTTVDRDNLYRIGGFIDWFDLAHGLRHPHGTYQLTRATPVKTGPAPIGTCDWYALTQQRTTASICWDTKNKIPLVIATQAGQVWRVNAIDHLTIPARTFAFDDRGYVRTNASRDMTAD